MFTVIFGVYGEVGGYEGKYNFESVRFFSSGKDSLAFMEEYAASASPSPYPPASAEQVGESGWYCRMFELLDGSEFGDGWICDKQGSPVDPVHSLEEQPYQEGR